MLRTMMILVGGLAISGAATAQQPQLATKHSEEGRLPVSIAGSTPLGPPDASFPQPYVVPNQMPARNPRPGLSPYLNLTRGATNGLNAVDYYNFVRPAQQSLGLYSGRQIGPYSTATRYGQLGIEPDVQIRPDSVLKSAGSPTTFSNTGTYFNSLGTIGTTPQQQQTQQQTQQPGRSGYTGTRR